MVPQSWMYKISGGVIKFIENTMENCTVELTAGGKCLRGKYPERGLSRRCVITTSATGDQRKTQYHPDHDTVKISKNT